MPLSFHVGNFVLFFALKLLLASFVLFFCQFHLQMWFNCRLLTMDQFQLRLRLLSHTYLLSASSYRYHHSFLLLTSEIACIFSQLYFKMQLNQWSGMLDLNHLICVMQPGAFDLVGTIYYEIDQQPYQSTFYNGTIEVVEAGAMLSIESVFLVTLGCALLVLLGLWIHGQIQHLSKVFKLTYEIVVFLILVSNLYKTARLI